MRSLKLKVSVPTGCENDMRAGGQGRAGGREGQRGTEREVHMGKRETKKAFGAGWGGRLPCAYFRLCVKFTFQMRVRASEDRSHVNTREDEGTTDSELTLRSQGHYLIIQVLSLFGPENMVLK